MIFPDGTGVATALVARNPHGYWRRDPESNRADRICNPTCKSKRGADLLDFIGEPSFMERMNSAIFQQFGRFLPDGVSMPAIRGFDSLHPLHASPCHTGHFPSESAARPSTDGRGIGHGFTLFKHRVCGVAA
jgi:hypothetical protein